MTNSSPRFALDCALVAAAALFIAGCGERDGKRELADGIAAYEVRDFVRADKLIEKSLAYSPNSVDALVAMARVKLGLGRIAEAEEALAKAAAIAPKDADILLLGPQLAYHAKDYKKAADGFAAFAADTAREPKDRANALVGVAVVEMTCNEIDRARVALLRALALDRRNAAARYHLGILYRNLGYLEAAQAELEAYVMLDKTADVRMQRVQRQVLPGIKDGIARKASERPGVDRRNSAASAATLAKADAEFKKGNFKAAKQKYAEALKLDALSYAAAWGQAQAIEKTDRTAEGRDRALDCYQLACTLKPGSIKTLLKTGAFAYANGSIATATEAYSRACAADPKSLEALDGLIRSLRKSGSEGVRVAALWQRYRDEVAASRKRK